MDRCFTFVASSAGLVSLSVHHKCYNGITNLNRKIGFKWKISCGVLKTKLDN